MAVGSNRRESLAVTLACGRPQDDVRALPRRRPQGLMDRALWAMRRGFVAQIVSRNKPRPCGSDIQVDPWTHDFSSLTLTP